MDVYANRTNAIAFCLHAERHGEEAGGRILSAETAGSGIAIRNAFAGELLRIFARARHATRRAKWDEGLKLLAGNPSKGNKAPDEQRRLGSLRLGILFHHAARSWVCYYSTSET